jgi:hypothetical protein
MTDQDVSDMAEALRMAWRDEDPDSSYEAAMTGAFTPAFARSVLVHLEAIKTRRDKNAL